FLNAATAAAERRPLAIVMLDDLYAFDPEEFAALARDVRASMVRVEEDIPAAKLALLLMAAIDDAAARRDELLPAWSSDDPAPEWPEEPAVAATNGRRTAPNPAQAA